MPRTAGSSERLTCTRSRASTSATTLSTRRRSRAGTASSSSTSPRIRRHWRRRWPRSRAGSIGSSCAALARVKRIDYEVAANWKLIFQNYNECLHCPTIHPELARLLPYTSGANDLVEGPYLGGHMLVAPPHKSVTVTGEACGLPLGDLSGDDLQRAYYYTIFPNLMLSLHPDYVVYYRVWPLAASRTAVVL